MKLSHQLQGHVESFSPLGQMISAAMNRPPSEPRAVQAGVPTVKKKTVENTRQPTLQPGPIIGILPLVRVAARAKPTIGKTLLSLSEAGFQKPLVFAEPDAGLTDCKIWPTKLGPVGSIKAVCELAIQKETHDWFLLCEDDLEIRPGTADYLRSLSYSLGHGLYSLYTSGTTQTAVPGWNVLNRRLTGSVCLLVRRDVLAALVKTHAWIDWRYHDRVDHMFHAAAGEAGVLINVHKPSLVQHTGETSAIYPRRLINHVRRAADYDPTPIWTPELTTLISPTGGRPESFALCERWMLRQRFTGALQWIVVDDGETPTVCTMGQEYLRADPQPPNVHTLCHNLRMALPHVRGRNVLIIEDDDYYGPDYVSTMVGLLQRADLIGGCRNTYYHVQRKILFEHANTAHASLCHTGFTATALGAVMEAATGTDHPSVDLRVWSKWRGSRLLFPSTGDTRRLCVGIKGGPGRGSHSRFSRGYLDRDGSKLRQWFGEDAEDYLS